MDMFTDTVTVLNKYSIMGESHYLKTLLVGVLFENCKMTNVKTYGSDSANKMICYIPDKTYEKSYVDNLSFANMTLDEKEKHWTLSSDTIIVLGDVTDEDITLSSLRKGYSDVMQVNSIDYLLRGSLRHWEVGGA